jgi:hypothetical protein
VVAWEDASQGFFGRWWATVKEACFNPRAFFTAASANDNPWPAVTFAMTSAGLGGLVIGVFMAILYLGMGGIGAIAASGSGSGAGPSAAVFGALGAVGIFAAIAYPIMFVIHALIVPWVWGGIQHLVLMMVGGATKTYTHSVRVYGYAMAGYAFMAIPCVGPFVAPVIVLVALVVGHDATHKCGIGKSLLAVIGVPILCVCCYLIGAFALGFAGGIR